MIVGLMLVVASEGLLIWGYRIQEWAIVLSLLAFASVGVGFYAPSAIALLGDITYPKGGGKAMGAYDSVSALSQIIGPVVGGVAISNLGFSGLAALGLMLTLLNLLMIVRRYHRTGKASRF
jgi:predicted MFS family arabinose efflux permease